MYEYYYIRYTPRADWYSKPPKEQLAAYRSQTVFNSYKNCEELVRMKTEIENAGGIVHDIYRYEFIGGDPISIYS